jgi:hypothetical protein
MSLSDKAIILPTDVQDYFSSYYKSYGYSLSILPKSSSKLMKAIGWLFGVTKISPEFMTRYITTIGDVAYFPDEMLEHINSERILRVGVHESVHLYDSKRFSGPLFKFLYLFPQSLAPLALLSFLAFWKIGFIWCLLFLLCLAPIPAPFRYWFELRAYRTQLMFSVKADKASPEKLEEVYAWIQKQLCTNLYYWTWPFPYMVRKHLEDKTIWDKDVLKTIHKWIVMREVIKNAANQIK